MSGLRHLRLGAAFLGGVAIFLLISYCNLLLKNHLKPKDFTSGDISSLPNEASSHPKNEYKNANINKEYMLNGADAVYDEQYINEKLEVKDAASHFMKYIHQPQIWCPQNVRLGRKEDGGWNACVSPPFTLKPSCIVYSFGIGGEWGFDDDVTKRFKCNLLAFDPTINQKEHKRSEYIHFYPEGLGGTNLTTLGKEKWPLKNFKEFLKKFNHSETVIDIVKMDVEYSEWAALDAMVRDGSLRNVKQLAFELHTNELLRHESGPSETSHFTQYWSVLHGLHEQGFRLWQCRENAGAKKIDALLPAKRSCCYELYFLNRKYITK